MSAQLHASTDVDDFIQLLHRPVQWDAEQRAFGIDLLQRYSAGNYAGSLARLIDTAAGLNDIETLQKIVASGELEGTIHDSEDLARTAEMVSSVTHMLVDGSGHEDFARAWLDKFDLQRHQVRLHLAALCRNTSRSTIDAQRLLAISQLTDFFACKNSNDTLPWASLSSVVFDRDSYKNQNQMFAAVLRELHPDDPPQVQSHKILRTQSSLIDVLWTGNPDSLGFLLPAIEMAYGKRAPMISDAMLTGCARFIDEGRLKAHRPSDHYDPRWEAIAQWADQQVATSILGAQMLTSEPFAYALAKMPFEEAKDRLDQLQAQGVDVLQRCHDKKTYGQVAGNHLLDAAVFQSNVPLVGHLLALGADPLASSNQEGDDIQVMNALELAEDMVRRYPSSTNAKDFAIVLDMIRSVLASRAAHDAIEELGLAHSKGRMP